MRINSLIIKGLAMVACLLSSMSTVGQEAYAEYTSVDSTLSFYFDDQRISRTGMSYDMNAMLAGCCCLTNLDLKGLNTANVENRNSMFAGCSRC